MWRLCFLVILAIWFKPGLGNVRFPSRKAWWVKQITADVYTAGRPTATQLKLAAEAGFKSVVSMFNFTTPDYLGEELIPNTEQSRDIVTRLAEMEFSLVYEEADFNGIAWASVETVHRFSQLYGRLPKPILFHCLSAHSSTLITLLHFANVSRHDPQFQPKLDKKELYRRAIILGFDFTTTTEHTQIINTITGELDDNTYSIKPDVSLLDWNALSWVVKPVYKNWYIAGMIERNHLPLFNATGFNVIINNRRGVVVPPHNTPAQEEVILLNIKDRTGTYTGSGRQSTEQLQRNRLDHYKPNEYISPSSALNYQTSNPAQFGDHVGYNETIERIYIQENWPFKYIHTPIGGRYKYQPALWKAYKEIWTSIPKDQHILVHCRTGYRSSVNALLAAGYINCKSSEWALDRARILGYHFEEDMENEVIELFRSVLDQEQRQCGEEGPGTGTGSAPPVISYTVLIIYIFITLTV